ncbi:MAG: molybdenum cofactor guanylyltransferase [Planctomycetaceae bacterium]|nr:molybdenum cofactor guanylyltransferase [Planctomycetales bacterium]MCB9926750.1 molybdenum cofactor guanylyltransferase [Planctomycetaceae bacterium]
MKKQTRIGGVLLCGGSSTRMGLPKPMLPFGQELLIERMIRTLRQVVEPIVVVSAKGQLLPDVLAGAIIAQDEREACGPLEGLRVGLAAMREHADAAYASSCDVPLLTAKFIRRMIAELQSYEAAVPNDGELYHPLAAVYRTDLVDKIDCQLTSGNLKMSSLFDSLYMNRVSLVSLHASDPELQSLVNVNTPTDYLKALKVAGFEVDSPLRSRFGL